VRKIPITLTGPRSAYKHNLHVWPSANPRASCRGEKNSVRVIPESTKTFVSQKPSKEWVFIAECICYGMGCNHACTLVKCLRSLTACRRRIVVDVWETCQSRRVHGRCVRTAKPFWPRSSCEHERRSRWPVRRVSSLIFCAFACFEIMVRIAVYFWALPSGLHRSQPSHSRTARSGH